MIKTNRNISSFEIQPICTIEFLQKVALAEEIEIIKKEYDKTSQVEVTGMHDLIEEFRIINQILFN